MWAFSWALWCDELWGDGVYQCFDHGWDRTTWKFSLFDPLSEDSRIGNPDATFEAPMSGKIVAVKVAENDVVHQGDVLIVVEAMKMEHAIKAPVDGVVLEVHYGVGSQVNEGAQLIAFKEY